jgi:hypothetical protein
MMRHLVLSSRTPVEFRGNYYNTQVGGGVALDDYQLNHRFNGIPNQRGHGFGAVWRGLLRIVRPLFVRGAKAVGKQALKTGSAILGDIAAGGNVGEIIKERAAEGGRELADTSQRKLDAMRNQMGLGKRPFSMNTSSLVYRPSKCARISSAKKRKKTTNKRAALRNKKKKKPTARRGRKKKTKRRSSKKKKRSLGSSSNDPF